MDISAIIIVWIVIAVIQSVFEKKKPTSNPPPNLPQNTSPDFEIPTLANDPNFPGEENSILIQDTTQSAEVQEINLAELYRQKKLATQTENNFNKSCHEKIFMLLYLARERSSGVCEDFGNV